MGRLFQVVAVEQIFGWWSVSSSSPLTRENPAMWGRVRILRISHTTDPPVI